MELKGKRVHSMNNKMRLDFLDSLRGIAALMVAYLHYSRYFLHEGLAVSGWEYEFFNFFNNYIDLGKVGVIIFFAISGMVIPFSLIKADEHPIKRFIVSRVARLYPIYWASIPVGIFAYWFLGGKTINFDVILINLTMLQQFFFVENVMGLYWTLQIELIFYGLCIVLFYLKWLNDSQKLFFITIGLIFIALIASYFRCTMQMKIPVALFLALVFMFFGTIWREYLINKNVQCKFYACIIFASLILVMPIVSLLAYNQDLGFGETWYRYLFSYYTGMFLIVLFTTFVKLRGYLFCWLGRISYSVYLFHGAIFVIFMHYVSNDFVRSSHLPIHLFIVVILILTLLFASFTYYSIEKPMINMGRKFNNKIFPKQQVQLGAI